jgi:hypothetical protein
MPPGYWVGIDKFLFIRGIRSPLRAKRSNRAFGEALNCFVASLLAMTTIKTVAAMRLRIRAFGNHDAHEKKWPPAHDPEN